MKVELKDVVVGNGKYSAEVELSEAAEAAIKEQGVLRVLQGAPSGAAEKELAYPGKGVQRPKGFSRSDIPFNDAFITAFTNAYENAEIEIGRNDKGEAIKEKLGIKVLSFEEYTGAEKAEPKYKAAKDLLKVYLFLEDGTTPKKLASGGERTATSFAESRGIAAPTEPWEEDTDFLKAVNDWQKAELAKKAQAD